MERGLGFALIAAGLMISVGACSGSGGSATPASPASDTTPPGVVSTSPTANTLDAPASCIVSATFSEPVDASTVTTTTFFVEDGAGARIPGTIAVVGDTAIFTPSAMFGYSATYTVTVTPGIRDRAGNGLPGAFTWHFSTRGIPDTTPPAVSRVSPANGASGVLVGAVVTATFTEALDAASVGETALTVHKSGVGSPVAGTITLSGATLTFTPATPLDHASTYFATVTHGVRDAAGNALASDQVWSFDTAAEPGAIGPLVMTKSPSAGASGVSRTTTISVTFDTAIAPASVTATSFSLKARNGAVVPGSFTVSGNSVTLTPGWTLFYWTTYDVALTTGIQDLAGHSLQGAVGWSFQIEPDLASSFPALAATPPEGATGVIAGTRVLALLNACGACTYDATSVNGASFTLVGAGGTPVPGTISFPGALANVAAFVPASPLTPGTRYTATLTTAVRTAAGTPLPAPYTWSFTTVAPGIYDEAFGAGGTFFGRGGGASAVAVQSDGKVVVAGSTPEPHQAFVFRTTAAGALDGTFGTAGEVLYTGGYAGQWANTTASAVALQPDGKILVAGRSYQGTATLGDAFLLRLDASGGLDGSFGTGGVVFRHSDPDAVVSGVAVQGSKIVLASYECPGATCDVVLLRYLGDGTPDPAFGTAGVVTYPGSVSGITVDSEGRLLAVGADVRRLLDNGSLDPAFGTNGIVASGGRLAAGIGGTVVLARIAGSDLVVERRLATGALDPAFGTGGQATLPGVANVSSDAVAVLPDGRIAVAGTLPTSGGVYAARVVRFTESGVLDSAFGTPPTAGQVICDVGPLDFTTGSAVAVAPGDGKIVFAGTYFEFALTGTTTRALVGRLH